MEKLIIGIAAVAVVLLAVSFLADFLAQRERQRQEAIQEKQERPEREAEWHAHWLRNGPAEKLRIVPRTPQAPVADASSGVGGG